MIPLNTTPKLNSLLRREAELEIIMANHRKQWRILEEERLKLQDEIKSLQNAN